MVATDLQHIDVSTMKVECPQGHRYTIKSDIIEQHAGRDAYECPECEMMTDACKARQRYHL